MKTRLLVIICMFGLIPQTTNAGTMVDTQTLSAFTGVEADHIGIECRQQTYSLAGSGPDAVLKMCLNQDDNQKRCEIALKALEVAPDKRNHIQFEFRLDQDVSLLKQFFILMQVQSFPDPGESWRCPVFSTEMIDGGLRMYDRWDPEVISHGVGYGCAGAGATIQGRLLFQNIHVAPFAWHSVDINGVLSATQSERLTTAIDGKPTSDVTGPNVYNDKRGPYLKLGIYKPDAWDPGNKNLCVEYRKVHIEVTPQSRD